jgi:hypothetical protein
MKHMKLLVLALASAAVLASPGITVASTSPPHLSAHTVTVQIKGLPHQCSVTAWEYFTVPPNGHQPWHFTMYYGAGTSCAGGGGLKFLTVEVDQKVGNYWEVVTNPVTNRIAQPTHHNPLRISTSWTALPLVTPTGAAYRVMANATVSYATHPSIPPHIVKGITEDGAAFTPATSP